MMFFSSNTCCVFLVLASVCNGTTSAKEAKVELSEDYHPALRGNSPTPVESLDVAQGRMLHGGVAHTSANTIEVEGFCVQAGAAIVFTHFPTVIHGGHVCAFGAVTGNYGIDYVFTVDNVFTTDAKIAPAPEGSHSELVTSAHCDPTAGDGTELDGSKSLFYILKDKLALPLLQDPTAVRNKDHYTVIDAELGGQTFYPGIYFASSLTIAVNTEVTLKGSGNFQFISGSTIVTGANTKVLLEEYESSNVEDVAECLVYGYHATNCTVHDVSGNTGITTTTGLVAEFSGTPASHQIEWAVTAAATLGSLSDVKGTILAGAAITLGAQASVSGCILALAGISLGADCDINKDNVPSPSQLDTN
jgi:hypothetical protein